MSRASSSARVKLRNVLDLSLLIVTTYATLNISVLSVSLDNCFCFDMASVAELNGPK